MRKSVIPKIIHYCWFGDNPLPDLAKKCIESWKKYCPDYEIKEWNDSNIDIKLIKNKYLQQAYEAKKWAFVSDYIRLYIIYNYGGVYFDTDVEVIKNIDEFLKYDAFFAKENNEQFNTGIGFGAIPKNLLVKKMLDEYKNIEFNSGNSYDLTPCPIRNTKVIDSFFGKIDFEDKKVIDNVCLLSKEYFCSIDYETNIMNISNNTYTIHHFSQSWLRPYDKVKVFIKRILFRCFGKKKVKSIIKRVKKTFRKE